MQFLPQMEVAVPCHHDGCNIRNRVQLRRSQLYVPVKTWQVKSTVGAFAFTAPLHLLVSQPISRPGYSDGSRHAM